MTNVYIKVAFGGLAVFFFLELSDDYFGNLKL